MLSDIISFLYLENIKVSGILSPDVFDNNVRIGYDLIDVATKERVILSRIVGNEDMIQIENIILIMPVFHLGKKSIISRM